MTMFWLLFFDWSKTKMHCVENKNIENTQENITNPIEFHLRKFKENELLMLSNLLDIPL